GLSTRSSRRLSGESHQENQMRVIDIRERTIPISRYADPGIPSRGLNTTAIAVVTDVHHDGAPIIGFGFSSIGRFGQSGLIRERFAPRLLAARETDLAMESGDNIDPWRAWDCLMQDEKPGGHGERCVAVGALDMSLWDAAAKEATIADAILDRIFHRAHRIELKRQSLRNREMK